MNPSRHETDALSDLAIRVLLRRTAQILLHTLQIPLKLLHSKQSRFRLLMMSLQRVFAQVALPVRPLREQR